MSRYTAPRRATLAPLPAWRIRSREILTAELQKLGPLQLTPKGEVEWRLIKNVSGQFRGQSTTLHHSSGLIFHIKLNVDHSLSVTPHCTVHNRPVFYSPTLTDLPCPGCSDEGVRAQSRSRFIYSFSFDCAHSKPSGGALMPGAEAYVVRTLTDDELMREFVARAQPLQQLPLLEQALAGLQLQSDFSSVQERWCQALLAGEVEGSP